MLKKWFLIIMAVVVPYVLFGAQDEGRCEGKFTLRYASMAPNVSPVNVGMKHMKEFVEKKSNGEIKVEIFPFGQIGKEKASLNKLKIGAIQSAGITMLTASTFEPKAGVLALPYVVKDYKDVEKFCQSKSFQKIGEAFEKKGLKLMGMASYGFYPIISKKKHIVDVRDYKNLKIRCIPAPMVVDMYKLLGASPTPLAYAELYTALQQGVVDATDCPLDGAYYSKQYEICKYVTLTKHLHGWWYMLVNKRWFDSLTAKLQNIVSDGFRQGCELAMETNKKYEVDMVEIFKEKGVSIRGLPDEKRQELLKAVSPMYEKYKDKIGGGFVEEYLNEMDFQYSSKN